MSAGRDEEVKPGWATPSAASSPPSTWERLSPSVGLLVVALVLVLVGRFWGAALAALVSVAIAEAALLSDRFVRRLQAVQHRVAHLFGTALTLILLVPVHYLILTPIGLALRLLRVDLLGPASGSDGWQGRSESHVEHPRRVYADERSTLAASTHRGRRARTVRTVLAVLAVEALLFGAFRVVQDRRTPVPEFGGASGLGPGESAALRDFPWVPETMGELGAAAAQGVYTPATMGSLRDFEGRYVNVKNRVRRSHATTVPGEPFDVWFFGGSTMFGFDAQRDEHTIPSEVVRLAEADGRPIRARNYGGPGMTNYQETLIFAQLVAAGERPDLAVFYDGINDTALGLLNTLAHLDVAGEPGQLQSDRVRDAWVAAEVIPGGNAAPPSPLIAGDEPVPAGDVPLDRLVDNVTDVYREGVGLADDLGSAHGIDVLHFWQPDMFSREPLDPGEQALVPSQFTDEFIFASVKAYRERLLAELPAETIDISTAFDGLTVPVLSDLVHVNEDGARAVAAAMYPAIGAALGTGD